jgi:cyclohexanone monooxygenase
VWYIPPFEGAADMDEFLQQVDDNDLAIMEGLRSRVDEVVKDRETAEALKPWYTTHCKRPGFSDEFLQAFNEPNAHMVDTKGKGMDEVTPKGFVVDGKEYEVDLIIYATGFETIVSPTRAGGFEVNGPGGYTLTEAWSEGFRSLHGLQMHGLPNLYLVGGLRHTGLSANVTFALSECGAHIAKSVKQFLEDGVIEVDVTDEAVQRWTDIIAEKRDMVYNAEQVANCTPGYYNNEGSSDASGAIDKNAPIYAYAYGGGPMEYFEILADWRDSRQYVNDAKVTAGTRG